MRPGCVMLTLDVLELCPRLRGPRRALLGGLGRASTPPPACSSGSGGGSPPPAPAGGPPSGGSSDDAVYESADKSVEGWTEGEGEGGGGGGARLLPGPAPGRGVTSLAAVLAAAVAGRPAEAPGAGWPLTGAFLRSS